MTSCAASCGVGARAARAHDVLGTQAASVPLDRTASAAVRRRRTAREASHTGVPTRVNSNANGNAIGHAEDGIGHVADTADATYADISPVDPGEMQVIDLTEVRHTYP